MNVEPLKHPDESSIPWWAKECEEGASAYRLDWARALVEDNRDGVLDEAIDFLLSRVDAGEVPEDAVFKRQALEYAAEHLRPYSAIAGGLDQLSHRFLIRRFGLLAFTTGMIVVTADVVEKRRLIAN